MTTSTPVPERAVDAAAEAVASPFPFAPRGTKGYSPAAVDDFLRLARAAFETPPAPQDVDDVEAELVEVQNLEGDASEVGTPEPEAGEVALAEPAAEPGAVEAPAAAPSAVETPAAAPFTSESVRHVSFALVRKGYAIGAVDAALGRIEDAFAAREREATVAAVGTAEWVESARVTAQEVLERLTRPEGKRFRRAGFLRFGYRIDEVDIVADKLVGFFERGDAITVEQVRAAAFRMQRRGYNEAQVDAVLDAVVEVMLAIR